jgi:hypothetical protein
MLVLGGKYIYIYIYISAKYKLYFKYFRPKVNFKTLSKFVHQYFTHKVKRQAR